MGVRTTFDDKVDRIRDDLDSLVYDLTELTTNTEEWGYDHYGTDFHRDLRQALIHVMQARNVL